MRKRNYLHSSGKTSKGNIQSSKGRFSIRKSTLIKLNKGLYVEYDTLREFFKGNPNSVLHRARLKGPFSNSFAKLQMKRALATFALRDGRIARFLRVLPFQLEIVYNFPSKISKRFIKLYQRSFEKHVSQEGSGNVLKRYKQISGIATRIAAGHKVDHLSWVKYQGRIPYALSLLKPYLLGGSMEERRAALCLSSLYKLTVLEGLPPSTDSILEKPDISVSDYGPDIEMSRFFQLVNEKKRLFTNEELNVLCEEFRHATSDLMQTFGSDSQRDSLLQFEAQNVHLSTKKGPNGPAIGSIPFDAHAWRDSQCESTKQSLLWIAKYIFNPNRPKTDKSDESYKLFLRLLNNDVKLFDRTGEQFLDYSKFSLSAIREKLESGGRVRLFGVIDWFTQTALKPLHDLLMKCLTMLPQDSSSDHNYAADQVWSLLYSGEVEVFSIDLTSATDSIPVLIQAEVLSSFIGEYWGPEFASNWVNLLTNRDFAYNKQMLRYGKGQPMGAYSSWAMLALWHHAIVRTCFYIVNRQRSLLGDEPVPMMYYIIGDDIVVTNREVYNLYLKIVRDLLGVKISPLKGYTPDTEDRTSPLVKAGYSITAGEIAKRVFTRDGEITPVPPDIWMDGCESPQGFTLLVNEIYRRYGSLDYESTVRLASLTYQSKWSLLAVSFPWSSAAFACGWTQSEQPSNEGTPWAPLLELFGYEGFCKSYITFMMQKYASYLDKYLNNKADAIKAMKTGWGQLFQFCVRNLSFKSLPLEDFLYRLYLKPHESGLYSDMLFQIKSLIETWDPDNDQESQVPIGTALPVVQLLQTLWYEETVHPSQIADHYESLIGQSFSLQVLLDGKVKREDNHRVVLSKFYYQVYRSFYERSLNEVMNQIAQSC